MYSCTYRRNPTCACTPWSWFTFKPEVFVKSQCRICADSKLMSFSCKRVLIFDGSAKELWPSIESTNWCYLMSNFLMQTLTYHQVSAYIYTHMFIFIYSYVCIYIHTMYAYMYAYINMYMCICVYAMEMMWKRNGNTAGFVGCVACI